MCSIILPSWGDVQSWFHLAISQFFLFNCTNVLGKWGLTLCSQDLKSSLGCWMDVSSVGSDGINLSNQWLQWKSPQFCLPVSVRKPQHYWSYSLISIMLVPFSLSWSIYFMQGPCRQNEQEYAGNHHSESKVLNVTLISAVLPSHSIASLGWRESSVRHFHLTALMLPFL